MDYLDRFGKALGEREIIVLNEKKEKITIPVKYKIGDIYNLMLMASKEDFKEIEYMLEFAIKVLTQATPDINKENLRLFVELHFKQINLQLLKHLGLKGQESELTKLKN